MEIPLGEICVSVEKVKRTKMPDDGALKYLDIGGIDNKTNRIVDHKEYYWKDAPSRAQQIVQVGDVLFSTVRTYLKNIAQVTDPIFQNEIASSGFTVIRGRTGTVYPRYLFYYSLSIQFLNPLAKLQTGSSYPAVRDKDVFAQLVPLPPLPEQRAIVGKLEQLFSELDSGIAELERAQEKLKVYSQAVLKKAFEGELTKASVRAVQMDEHASLITKGASPKWQGFNYTNDNSQLLFVTSENVREGYLSLEKEKYLPWGFNDIQARSVLQQGDVLFNIVGASIGRAAIYNIDKAANINQAVALIRLNSTLSNAYLNYFLNSEIARQAYLAKQVDVARANLSLKDVREIEVPFCSLEEQHQIVQAIESRLSVCDKLEESIATNLQKAEALRQSILKKAYEGHLLSTAELAACQKEKDWCPAWELLERVKGRITEHKENAGKRTRATVKTR